MENSTKIFNIARALVVGIALSGCLFTGARADTLKIGIIAPLTGAGAPWGIATAEAVKIVASEVNASGGLDVGGKKYQVESVPYDDQYKAADAVAAYNRLVNQDDVKYVIVFGSSSAIAIKQNIEDDKIVSLTMAASPQIFDEDTKYMFRATSVPVVFMPSLIKWMGENMKEKRLVILNPNDESGWGQAKYSETLFKQNGFDVVGNELFERTQQDFQPILTKIISQRPDLIDLGTTSPATSGLIVRQARDLGYKGQFAKTSGPGWKEIVASAGKEAIEGLLCMLFADPANEDYKRISSAYEKSIGQEPNEVLVSIYDSTNVLLRAVQYAGDVTDTAKVAASIAKVLPMTSLQGEEIVLGTKDVPGGSQQIHTYIYIGEIHDGVPVVVGKVR